jgi:hypothetical protein
MRRNPWGALKQFDDVPVFPLGTESPVLFLNVAVVIEQRQLYETRGRESSVGIATLCRLDNCYIRDQPCFVCTCSSERSEGVGDLARESLPLPAGCVTCAQRHRYQHLLYADTHLATLYQV